MLFPKTAVEVPVWAKSTSCCDQAPLGETLLSLHPPALSGSSVIPLGAIKSWKRFLSFAAGMRGMSDGSPSPTPHVSRSIRVRALYYTHDNYVAHQ